MDAGTQRTAHYTNMAPGEYSFQVIAANSYGIWNDQGANLRFVLRPHFYQTNWFYALCAATLLALLWMAHQFRLRQLQRAFNMRLEERVEERTRIARELHDTLLQSFQGLMFSFQAARNLLPGRTEEAIRTLDGAIREGDEAVAEGRDAIQNLRLGSAQRRLEDLLTATGQELRDAQDGNSRFGRFPGDRGRGSRKPCLLCSRTRSTGSLVRYCETLSGTLAHSRIEAAIQYDPNLFRLRIRDDGKGIDPAGSAGRRARRSLGVARDPGAGQTNRSAVETLERKWSRHGSGVDRSRLRRLRWRLMSAADLGSSG